jgi:hypothetical protein
MAIEMSKKYRTRDWRDVRLLCVDGPGKFPVVGLIKGQDEPATWDANGVFSLDSPTDLDLIEVNPYADIAIDTPGWARDTREGSSDREWVPVYFAGVDKDYRPSCFRYGCTSHTSGGATFTWDEFTTTKPEEGVA